jgi:predicted nucleic acid-binding protein
VALTICDTDVLVDALRGRGESERVADELRAGRLATTAISLFELLAGAKEGPEKGRVVALLAPLPILPFDELAAAHAARARIDLERRGLAIGMADLQIAGICLSREMRLWTRDRAHFERIEGLRLF